VGPGRTSPTLKKNPDPHTPRRRGGGEPAPGASEPAQLGVSPHLCFRTQGPPSPSSIQCRNVIKSRWGGRGDEEGPAFSPAFLLGRWQPSSQLGASQQSSLDRMPRLVNIEMLKEGEPAALLAGFWPQSAASTQPSFVGSVLAPKRDSPPPLIPVVDPSFRGLHNGFCTGAPLWSLNAFF